MPRVRMDPNKLKQPKAAKRLNITFRLSHEFVGALNTVAEQENITRGALVRHLLAEALAQNYDINVQA